MILDSQTTGIVGNLMISPDCPSATLPRQPGEVKEQIGLIGDSSDTIYIQGSVDQNPD
jgi:hypothetical protein